MDFSRGENVVENLAAETADDPFAGSARNRDRMPSDDQDRSGHARSRDRGRAAIAAPLGSRPRHGRSDTARRVLRAGIGGNGGGTAPASSWPRDVPHLLFDASTFKADDNLLNALFEQPEKFDLLQEEYEYFRRLPLTPFGGVHAQPGVRWVLDLLPRSPGRAVSVIESYAIAHVTSLPSGGRSGLDDAAAVINAYYIGNSTAPWREALMGISPRQFECLTARLYREMGFDVTLTPPANDKGRDVVAVRTSLGGKQKLLVECKLYQDVVSVGQARKLLGSVSEEGATGGVLVTSGRCSKWVQAFAAENDRFDFVDGDRLVRLLNEHFGPLWIQRLDLLSRPL